MQKRTVGLIRASGRQRYWWSHIRLSDKRDAVAVPSRPTGRVAVVLSGSWLAEQSCRKCKSLGKDGMVLIDCMVPSVSS